MPLLPQLQPLFEALTSTSMPTDIDPAEAREATHRMIEASYNALMDDHAPVASEVDRRVTVNGGEITVRVYTPDVPGLLPCHLYLHGGGFWLGTLDHADSACRAIAQDAGCVVVSVDYRLAPEAKFPTAAEDSYSALLWIVDHAGELRVDVSRLSTGGGSAGGNLAAVVALMTRDRGGPPLVFQVLEIPVTDFTRAGGLDIPEEGISLPSGKEHYRSHYLAALDDARNPYASPLLAEDLSGLPPALVMCAEYDELCAEGMEYAARLTEAGVAVESRRWEGQFHGSQSMGKLIPAQATEYHAQVVRALRDAYSAA